ncbi:uncharacterized protein LOC131649904 [Vicia villosa]|uniref:uncharacterized protein LOC131649904 n=1 Tax=Vicia villosa TaxID=3911 RepID=UPI00273CD488|nr:uncharacterized protein LOC131649904 [Vicia villosa]
MGFVTYKSMVTGESNGMLQEEEEEVEIAEQDKDGDFDLEGIKVKECKIGGYDCLQIILSKYEEKRIQRPWRRGVIVKLLGRKIGYKALETRLKQMWVRKGVINIIDLSHDYYLVAFTHEDDKNAALADGPWFIYDHYLTVKEWSPDFHPESDAIVNVAVWIRISGLPVEYYDPKVLHVIGDLVGRTVKVDKNTLQRERGKYARICVEVNISKPLLAMFSIKDSSYKIEYEGLHLLCLTCGKFGHYKEGCSLKIKGKEIVTEQGDKGKSVGVQIGGTTQGGMSIDEGPWQVVQKQRRGRKTVEVKKKQPTVTSWVSKSGSRFSSLGADVGETSGLKSASLQVAEIEKEIHNEVLNGINKVVINGNDEQLILSDMDTRIHDEPIMGNQNFVMGTTGSASIVADKQKTLNKGGKRLKQVDQKGRNKSSSKLATRGNNGFKEKHSELKRRTIEDIYGKRQNLEFLENSHISMQPMQKTQKHTQVREMEDFLTETINDTVNECIVTTQHATRPPDQDKTVDVLTTNSLVEGAVIKETITEEDEEVYESIKGMEEEAVKETPLV